jgi:hypothetical protein
MSNARRWIDFLMPDALTMHSGWIRDLVGAEARLLERIAESPTARLLLTRSAYKRHEIAVPGRVTLDSHQQWLLLSHEAQRALARRLAIEALHEAIRTTVSGSLVSALRKQLGEADYERALRGESLQVEGLDRAAFREALERHRLADYLLAIGAALLATTTHPGDPFCRARMRFAFSPKCWMSRAQGIRVDADELTRRILTLTQV